MRTSLLLAALVALAAPAASQTCTTEWASPTSGSWSVAANWTAGVPSGADTACITADGTYTVVLDREQNLEGLVVGGDSGTQTLDMNGTFLTLGSGTIRPNGRVENRPRTPTCNICRGFPSVTGTLTLEGVFVHRRSTDLLRVGGTLDVAPGGRLILDAAGGADLRIGEFNTTSTLRVRGRVEATPSGTSLTSRIRSTVEVIGGIVAMNGGQVNVESEGLLRNATFNVAEGAILRFYGNSGSSRIYLAEGTLSGDIQGALEFTGSELRAGVDGVTLDVGGNGLLGYSGSGIGTAFSYSSAGGEFVNTGLVRSNLNGVTLRAAIFRNRGTLRFERTSIVPLTEGAVLRNEAVGTLELTDGAGFRRGDETGRVINEGLLLARLDQETVPRRSVTRGRLRSRPGSEIRVLEGIRLELDPPASASLPADVRLTGTGEIIIQSAADFLVEGTISPGTEAEPIAMLGITGAYLVSQTSGSPQLVIDVDAGGVSDQIAFTRTVGFSFPIRPSGTLVVRVRPGYTPSVGDTFTILQTTGTTSQIQGAFTRVVADGAPDGIAFVAETSADGLAILVRAVEVAPGGLITVSDTAPVGGGVRPIFLSGPGAPGISSARLVCTECLDADAFGTIPATLVGDGTLREARFDLTSPRIYGLYDLVVQRPGQPDVVTPITVRPFLSFIVMTPGITRGIGVRPAGIRYNWSALAVSNVTNADAPGYTVAAIGREDDEQVALALASSNLFGIGGRLFDENIPGDEPPRPLLAFARITQNASTSLTYGQRIDPSEVLFPEQTPTGADDRRIPFGELRTVLGTAAQHASFARMSALIVDALRDTDDATLAAYLANVEAGDPGVTERAVGLAINRTFRYVEGTASLFERILGELDDSQAVPAGLETSAAGAFSEALDRATGAYLVAMYNAVNIDSQAAPASVLALLDAEVVALGGPSFGGAAPRRPEGGSPGVCRVPSPPPLPPPFDPSGEGEGFGGGLLDAVGARVFTQADRGQLVQSATAIHEAVHVLHAVCRSTSANTGSDERGAPAGSCTLPPAPPGGSPGGGGGACGPPSAPADPNDKTALGQYRCELGTVVIDGEEVTRCVRYFVPLANATEPIVYSVAFENLPQATANAEFVTITDELDPNLDPSTLEVYSTSADSLFSVTTSGQTATFRFIGIDLPPNVNEPEGQGFVTFGIRPRAGLAEGTEIRNDADIVFDFNPPISTPEVIHEIRQSADLATVVLADEFVETGASAPVEVFAVNLVGDPASDAVLTISLPAGVTVVSATPETGECSGAGPVTCALGTLEAGAPVPVMLVIEAGGVVTGEIVATVTTSAFDAFAPNDTDRVAFEVRLVGTEDDAPGAAALAPPFPNPARGAVSLQWTTPTVSGVDLRVFDLLGREVAVLADDEPFEAGSHTMSWPAEVAAGVYVVRFRAGDVTQVRRVVVIR